MKIAILTTKDQWFTLYAKQLQKNIKNSLLYHDHKNIKDNFDIIFILSYHNIIKEKYLFKSKHNIVVHASTLPEGKGWSPLFWQILENKNKIPFTMFEASNSLDSGDIYMQNELILTGYELNEELREKQAHHTIKMCLEFINNYNKYKTPTKQTGKETFYKRRTAIDSKLDINKSIKKQFNLLRIVNNENYPAFFELNGNRYILKINLDKMGGVTLIDFVDLSLEKKQMILNWRNHSDIRRWMYTQNDIKLKEHLSFINELEKTDNKQYLLVKKNNKYLGVVCFTNINKKECEFGLYANPFDKTTGVGKILEKICIKYAFDLLHLKKLKLEVFGDNDKAINLYKKFNFRETSKKIINNKDVLCMELENVIK